MEKFTPVTLGEPNGQERIIFDEYIEHDGYGELVDKSVVIKVHKVGPDRILLEIPTSDLADQEEYFFGLLTAAAPLLQKGYKIYKNYKDTKKKPGPSTILKRSNKKSSLLGEIMKAVQKHPQVKQAMEANPAAAKFIEETPEEVPAFAGEFLEEQEESGELEDSFKVLADEIWRNIR